jgi:DNA-binding MarR family transcriptional regulator
MPNNEPIEPDDERINQTLLWALKPFDNLDRKVPVSYVIAFLAVALEEGKPIGAYARDLACDRFQMTRHIRSIGDKGRHSKEGLGLVTVKRSSTTPVRTAVYLSDKGRAIAQEVFGILRRVAETPRD